MSAAKAGRLDAEVAGKTAIELGAPDEAVVLMNRVFETGEPISVDEFRLDGGWMARADAETFLRLTLQADAIARRARSTASWRSPST